MSTISRVTDFLDRFAPARLAEDWDNVGLLVGDQDADCDRIMTCLTITPASAAEAIEQNADLIVTHHPLPFHPLKRLTTETTVGRMLLDLIAARIAIYSPHTAFDSAAAGINQRLAQGLGLRGVLPLHMDEQGLGAGRTGWLDGTLTLADLGERMKTFLKIDRYQAVGDLDRPVRSVAVACGAAGEFLTEAQKQGCDALVVGETNFHTCLEAEATGVGLLLPGHFASERFAVQCLAEVLGEQFSDLAVWASCKEHDPVLWC